MAKIRNVGTVCNTDYLFRGMLNNSISGVIKIPDGITNLRSYCFYGCGNITNIIFPDTLWSIGGYCFYSMSGIDVFDLSDTSITYIDIRTFASTRAKKIVYPISFTGAGGSYVYENMSSLQYLICLGNVGNFASNALTSITTLKLLDLRNTSGVRTVALSSLTQTFYVNIPDSLVDSYKADSNWQAKTNARFVHSCDVATFNDIQNPVTNEYYSLKGDTNYKNPLGQTQLDVRKWNGSAWVDIDIDA